jgi:hypothetical protein
MQDQVKLLVKHGVSGRMLLDSSKQPVNYTVDPLPNDAWNFTIEISDRDTVDQILGLKDELNVFIFEEAEGKPVVKNWYYVNPDLVNYDPAQRRLTIGADSRISYLPSDYLA